MIVTTFSLILILFTTGLYKTTCFNSQKVHYISYSSSLSSTSYNVYDNANMEIIIPSDNVLDIDICMSNNCSFEFYINNLCKKCLTCLVGA